MSQAIEQLEKQFRRIAQIDHATTFLSWDQMVMMPNQGMAARSAALAELATLRHEFLTVPAMGCWLAEASEAIDSTDITRSSHLREMRRTWQQATAVPAELVHAQVMAGSQCEHGWRTQRTKNDWPGFLENFREVVALSRQEAQCRQAHAPETFATPYDALLDLHCAGDSQALISEVFATLKRRLPELLHKVMAHQASRPRVDLSGHYPVNSQHSLNEQLMKLMGFEFDGGRLDVSLHPFSTGVKGDLRITTRFRDTDFADALQATAHETGHASYESGLPVRHQGFPVGLARNMCIHESQSLLFEKQIFLSKAFGQALLAPLHEYLPSTRVFSANDVWVAQTGVRPSYIRVEADEVTYPLHVMLRYDIESALINGDMEPADIPDAWDAAMQSYLGLSTSGNHALGCMQDIHWTDGAFGYFPSYTMGAVNAAQIGATIKRAYPDWQSAFAQGDIGFVREWLSTKIWQRGSELESQDLMRSATGESSNPNHLLQHIENRYLLELD